VLVAGATVGRATETVSAEGEGEQREEHSGRVGKLGAPRLDVEEHRDDEEARSIDEETMNHDEQARESSSRHHEDKAHATSGTGKRDESDADPGTTETGKCLASVALGLGLGSNGHTNKRSSYNRPQNLPIRCTR